MNKSVNVCNNCKKSNHLFNQCKLPITSYGIILCKKINKKLYFLMIRRKDSYGYIDLIRGKYSLNNIYQIKNIVDEMSIFEKEKILKNDHFNILWNNLWDNEIKLQYINEEKTALKKFEIIKNGINNDKNIFLDEKISIDEIINESATKWTETEWEFPKGRRNNKEKELDCALREFEEETGINKNKITVIKNILPFEETFI